MKRSITRQRLLRAAPIWPALALLMAAVISGGSASLKAAAPKAAPPAAATALTGDPVAGAHLYQSCMGCHSLDDNDVGPKHRGVVGRTAGTVPGYAYSVKLRQSGIVWTPANIDRWLTNPQAMVPGAKMFFSVANPKNRADIIAYLAQQK